MGPPEPFGPNQAEVPAKPPQEIYGPTPIQLKSVVLVLGPGMARGYAFAGALRAMSDAKIPIGAIFGTEIGGFMGALYGIQGNINHFEWALMRFREEAFETDRKTLSRLFDRAGNNGKFDSGLQQVFGHTDLSRSKIPLRLAIEQSNNGQPAMIAKGDARSAVRAAMAVPGLVGDAQWDGSPVRSADRVRPFMISEARALGLGPVVVINVLPELSTAGILGEADLVIQPDMKGIGPTDFGKRTEAAFRGKQAVKQHLRELRLWVGLPQEGS